MNTIEIIKENAILLNKLSTSENELFEYINKRKENLEEVIRKYKPERDFRPVNTLRFLIAKEIKKGTILDTTILEQLKVAIENRDVSTYYDLNDSVQQSLVNYKNSKVGMFPNWKHAFKILFPFIHNSAENEEVKILLNQLADNIIEDNRLEDVTKHIVSFQGSQNYGSDRVWVAIIPKTAPSVQYAYQLFFTIDLNGLAGGLHKGHNLVKQEYQNQDLKFNIWDDYLKHTRNNKDEWSQLNTKVNFLFINDEKEFEKTIKKVDINSLSNYFNILDNLKEDLDIQDEEKLVFSLAKNRLSFQIGKRYCLNIDKETFDYISNKDSEPDNSKRELFSGEENTYLYNDRKFEEVLDNYEEIKFAVENEIERDNHALAKSYDNSAFRKALFDKEYRIKIFNLSGKKSSYYLVGAYWKDNDPEDQTDRFIENSVWENGYDDQFFDLVKKVKVGDQIAIRSLDKRNDIMYIKARGIVSKNLNDGQNLEVEWEDDFEKFKLDFTGGYWQTIRKLHKENHINSIWSKKGNMKNFKKEFINWLINKPKSNYFNNDEEVLNRYLDSYNTYFDIDIFEVSKSNYKTIIDTIDKVAYQDENSVFFKYSDGESSHRPRAILGKTNYYQFLKEKFDKLETVVHHKISYKAPLNQIFYGPPGTGKTYNTILEAAKIITQDENISYEDAQKEFQLNLGTNLEFITFHQNYSYEDFIQGLRPDTNISGELSFFKSDGVFKRLADKALKNLKDAENPETAKNDFNEVFNEIIKPLNEGDKEELEIKMKKTSYYITEVGEKSIEFRKNQGDSKHTLSINTLNKMYDKGVNDLILGGLQPYYNPILQLLLEKSKKNITQIKKQNYVIIIDEINRANISRVFGELITLIEKDKRSNGSLPITATLPSGEKFIVPSNLYIIGTMNTADKSIALLDIALRRRFEFKAMYPKYLIPNKTIHKSTFLETLNDLIIKSGKGHDFTIGHSYFMDDGDNFNFEKTINNKVIPLMLEYYMNDEDEVKKIVNEALKQENYKIGNWPLEIINND